MVDAHKYLLLRVWAADRSDPSTRGARVVIGADNLAGLDTAASQQRGDGKCPVVATDVFVDFPHMPKHLVAS
jgi:hypothetical protein